MCILDSEGTNVDLWHFGTTDHPDETMAAKVEALTRMKRTVHTRPILGSPLTPVCSDGHIIHLAK
jgi:hypothetical protein